jgi:hypothetical protein
MAQAESALENVGHDFSSGDRVVANYGASLYEGPSTLENTIGELGRDDQGRVLGYEDPYYKVRFPNREGWVLDSNLLPAGPQRRKEYLTPKVSSVEESIARLFSEVSSCRSPDFFFSSLPPASDSTKTGSKGRFELSLKKNTPYYLTAQAERSIVDTEEKYYWTVETNLSNNKKEIILSNDNMGKLSSKKYAMDSHNLEVTRKVFDSLVSIAKEGKDYEWDKIMYNMSFSSDTTSVRLPETIDILAEGLRNAN